MKCCAFARCSACAKDSDSRETHAPPANRCVQMSPAPSRHRRLQDRHMKASELLPSVHAYLSPRYPKAAKALQKASTSEALMGSAPFVAWIKEDRSTFI